MLEHLLTVESFVYFSWLNGVILHPSLPMNFILKLSRVNAAVHWPITLIFPDGQQQEVKARFFQSHIVSKSGPNRWATECFLEGFESIQEGTEVWCNMPDEPIVNHPQRTCRVIKEYQAEYPGPIAVEAGERFALSEKTSVWEDNPEWIWIWCTDQRGKSWWVPKNIIQMDGDGKMGSTRVAYNAIGLTVSSGQELTIEQEESGWFWCCDQQKKCGWVPISHVVAFV